MQIQSEPAVRRDFPGAASRIKRTAYAPSTCSHGMAAAFCGGHSRFGYTVRTGAGTSSGQNPDKGAIAKFLFHANLFRRAQLRRASRKEAARVVPFRRAGALYPPRVQSEFPKTRPEAHLCTAARNGHVLPIADVQPAAHPSRSTAVSYSRYPRLPSYISAFTRRTGRRERYPSGRRHAACPVPRHQPRQIAPPAFFPLPCPGVICACGACR